MSTEERLRNACRARDDSQFHAAFIELMGRIITLEQWVNDLQSGMYINCVYCGHRYGPREDTPVAMADVLKEHIGKCPAHPLAEAYQALDNIRDAVLYDRHQLAELDIDVDITNAVLGVIDDHDPRPDIGADHVTTCPLCRETIEDHEEAESVVCHECYAQWHDAGVLKRKLTIAIERAEKAEAAHAFAEKYRPQFRDMAGMKSDNPHWGDICVVLDAKLQKLVGEERAFPIQPQRDIYPHPLTVPWSVAEKAYSQYAAKYGTRQSLERLAERGGFSAGEMDEYYPKWREDSSEITALRKRLWEAYQAIDAIRDAVLHDLHQLADLKHIRCDVTHAVLRIIDEFDPRTTEESTP